MDEQGRTWQRRFAGHPAQARAVRTWVHALLGDDADAELVASELFAATALGRDAVTMTVSTAGSRIRIYATSLDPLTATDTHGPWRPLVDGIADAVGSDTYTVWADLTVSP